MQYMDLTKDLCFFKIEKEISLYYNVLCVT